MVHHRRETGFTGWDQVPGFMREINTARGYWVRGDTLFLSCQAHGCSHSWLADFQAYIERGWGDIDLREIRPRWRCPKCGRREIGTSRGAKGEYGPPRRGLGFGARG
ncbi:hypothetical protein [Caulobacter sp. BP25]|uniref:hypothetical protein n=1 Tax=Caulobacter sp. BP25 TaxID=2048900 RepID=UPI000C12C283|nr:hypothetical protein [Caulobacter sp. BP25]PHY20826.1 hypothetical protein CSW59_06270 [Caulobacter sp. BP25]